jgi:chitinase
MVQTPERRAAFIASVVDLLVQYNFNGLDFDWEFPGNHDSNACPFLKPNTVCML